MGRSKGVYSKNNSEHIKYLKDLLYMKKDLFGCGLVCCNNMYDILKLCEEEGEIYYKCFISIMCMLFENNLFYNFKSKFTKQKEINNFKFKNKNIISKLQYFGGSGKHYMVDSLNDDGYCKVSCLPAAIGFANFCNCGKNLCQDNIAEWERIVSENGFRCEFKVYDDFNKNKEFLIKLGVGVGEIDTKKIIGRNSYEQFDTFGVRHFKLNKSNHIKII